jgi:hypothetical protein
MSKIFSTSGRTISSDTHRSYGSEDALIKAIEFHGWSNLRHYRVKTAEGRWTPIFAGTAAMEAHQAIAIANYRFMVVS